MGKSSVVDVNVHLSIPQKWVQSITRWFVNEAKICKCGFHYGMSITISACTQSSLCCSFILLLLFLLIRKKGITLAWINWEIYWTIFFFLSHNKSCRFLLLFLSSSLLCFCCCFIQTDSKECDILSINEMEISHEHPFIHLSIYSLCSYSTYENDEVYVIESSSC